jgi:competence protein CoiA
VDSTVKYKYALVDGVRREAEPGLSGECQLYGHPMVAKCGPDRVWHWAHRHTQDCDRWWKNEGEWHLGWKNQFPEEWQEIPLHAPDGKSHYADVVTAQGNILEFQYSFLNPAERRARNHFYGDGLIWIVNGERRIRDRPQIEKAWKDGFSLPNADDAREEVGRAITGAFRLAQEWRDCPGPVFFDFARENLAWLLRVSGERRAYVSHISRTVLVAILRGEHKYTSLGAYESANGLMRAVDAYEREWPALSLKKRTGTRG